MIRIAHFSLFLKTIQPKIRLRPKKPRSVVFRTRKLVLSIEGETSIDTYNSGLKIAKILVTNACETIIKATIQ